MHQSNEALRKSLHIAPGFAAISLRWLPWYVAAAVALAAVFSNWLLLHRIVGRSVARHERGFDAGIVLYPLMVLLLILIFRNDLVIAALGWATLAFGDGIATLVGKSMPLARLPWHRDKSWGGFLSFALAAFVAMALMQMVFGSPFSLATIAIAALASAIAESLPTGVDDNITVPLACATVLAIAAIPGTPEIDLTATVIRWLVVNSVLAAVGYLARSVTISGALGGWLLGAILIVFGGPPLYIALLAFFIIGTLCTKLGYARKARLGLAQESGGRRGFSHAFSNVGVASICALAAHDRFAPLALTMGIASLATAAADTTASEIGQLIGKRAFLPLTLRRVAVGTEGAISIEGTLAGIAAGALVSAIAVWSILRTIDVALLAALTLAAFLGSYLESIAGSWNRKQQKRVANGALNFLNTAAGALFLYIAWQFGI
ncbi:MAG TPA: DUF92 domain-containing protein [Thermoanaerobaculia bacterium]